MATMAAVFGFVACSNDDNDQATVAVFETADDGTVDTITLFDDNTSENVLKYKGREPATFATGTYKCDVTKDTGNENHVTFTIKKLINTSSLKLEGTDKYQDVPAKIDGDELDCAL